MRQRQSNLKRKLLVLVPETATVQTVTKPGVEECPTSLASAKAAAGRRRDARARRRR
jgi:hypothetical protein